MLSVPRPLDAESPDLVLPLILSPVPAGFPSPAEDHWEPKFNLHEYLVTDRAGMFFMKVEGASMTGIGIMNGDLLVVAKGRRPREGSVVVAVVGGEYTVKTLARAADGTWELRAHNPAYRSINLLDGECSVWGVVTGVVRRYAAG